MATSLTMMASFLGSVSIGDRPSSINHRRSLVVTNAATEVQCQEMAKPADSNGRDDKGSSRRAAMLAVAAAAVCAIGISSQGMAIAGEEPKRGSPEARKFYAPVCVTMPTARICNK
ncbi:photosystem II 5 kDa protein, chloroplastic [Elaeis guineensis]|uniref:Photosystem II 5 kDa protein, chloroplastic n=1 Tax=Elaeis guineensis var. tenera TaxID=51953 RepID=A0A6I9QFI9_ELAGV|nr:photosystem II 5 kDa protein, chloroplastic [Elaeis guineensis]